MVCCNKKTSSTTLIILITSSFFFFRVVMIAAFSTSIIHPRSLLFATKSNVRISIRNDNTMRKNIRSMSSLHSTNINKSINNDNDSSKMKTSKTTVRRTSSSKNSVDSSDSCSINGSDLEWERFDFSDKPKWDNRFDSWDPRDASVDAEVERKKDIEEDRMVNSQLNKENRAWAALDDQTVEDATKCLLPYIQPKRSKRITEVLSKRTCHTHFLFENPSNPSNVWACLRTLDSFGIQHIHLVIDPAQYTGRASLSQKRGMRTAMGSAQWLTLHPYSTAKDAIQTLKHKHNFRIMASDLNPSSVDIRNIQWNRNNNNNGDGDDNNNNDNMDQPICIVMGNENHGISPYMREMADETFTLPMVGFAESFNLSVATAITLAHLSAVSKNTDNESNNGGTTTTSPGPLRPGDMPLGDYNRLVLKGILNSMPNKKVASALLRSSKLHLPREILKI